MLPGPPQNNAPKTCVRLDSRPRFYGISKSCIHGTSHVERAGMGREENWMQLSKQLEDFWLGVGDRIIGM